MAGSRRSSVVLTPIETARAVAYGAGVKARREHPVPLVGSYPAADVMQTWLDGHELAALRRLGGHVFWSRFLLGYGGFKATTK